MAFDTWIIFRAG